MTDCIATGFILAADTTCSSAIAVDSFNETINITESDAAVICSRTCRSLINLAIVTCDGVSEEVSGYDYSKYVCVCT